MRSESRGGIAAALAASSLRYDDRPGKLSLAVAYGNFMGPSGMAAGLGYSWDGRFRFNAAMSAVPQRSDFGGTVGASFTLN